jgi:adenylosuccinate lyase
MLILMIRILKGLQVDKQRMKENMEITQGRMMSEALMLTLAKKGLGRQKAHELTRKLALKSYNERRSLKEILLEDTKIKKFLEYKEIEQVMDPQNYLGTAQKQIENVIKKTEKERKSRNLTD